MNHYCTYFDRGYLAQGLALWASLARHDAAAVLWVLALDGETETALRGQADARLCVLPLEALLRADAALAAVRPGRSHREFVFTLTPCLPRHLLQTQPEIEVLVYLDADLFFFADPAPIRRKLGGGAVLVVPHGYPAWHDDAARYGAFNVGVLAFRSDPRGRACLDGWREQCLDSCALTADGTHYGDQKYLDAWPRRYDGVVVARHPGVNLAPWNWAGRRCAVSAGGVRVEGAPLIVFHFAQFRAVRGRWFDSGQLEYGVMPLRLRSYLYGAYWRALQTAEAKVRAVMPEFRSGERGWPASLGDWRLAALRICCGQFWLRIGPWWVAGRLGLGRFSGRAMGAYRAWQRRRPGGNGVLVVTPTLGESPWLAETVASVAAAVPAGRHVLVAPAAAVADLRARFPQATVIAEPEGGGGMYAAINAGVAAAGGGWEMFTYLNDDDVLLPRFAAVVAEAAKAEGKALLAYGGVRLMDARGRRIGAIPIARYPSHHRALYAQRLEPVYQHGTVVTRAAWLALGGFDATLRFCGDTELLARACVRGIPRVRACGAEVAAFRLHAGQLTQNRPAMEAERIRVDDMLGLLAVRRTGWHRWVRGVFRVTNLPVYAERVLRHGWVTFDQLLGRAGSS